MQSLKNSRMSSHTQLDNDSASESSDHSYSEKGELQATPVTQKSRSRLSKNSRSSRNSLNSRKQINSTKQSQKTASISQKSSVYEIRPMDSTDGTQLSEHSPQDPKAVKRIIIENLLSFISSNLDSKLS